MRMSWERERRCPRPDERDGRAALYDGVAPIEWLKSLNVLVGVSGLGTGSHRFRTFQHRQPSGVVGTETDRLTLAAWIMFRRSIDRLSGTPCSSKSPKGSALNLSRSLDCVQHNTRRGPLRGGARLISTPFAEHTRQSS